MKIKKSHIYFSMVKHVERWKLSKDVDRKHKAYVRSFPLTEVKCMKNFVKPRIRIL